jgi:hypothetical protein
MLYGDIYSVPANTTAINPSVRTIHISKGTIKQWVIYGPDEIANQLHVRVSWNGHKILPYGDLLWMYPLTSSSPIIENLKIDDFPLNVVIEAYNEDDSYPHEYIIYLVIEPTEPVKIATSEEAGLWDRLRAYFGGE